MPLTCRGSGADAPWQVRNKYKGWLPCSGLPLCETCLSSAAHCKKSGSPFSGIFQNKKAADDGGLVCVERLCRKTRLLPFAENLDFRNRLFTCPPVQVPDNHVLYRHSILLTHHLPFSSARFPLLMFLFFRLIFFPAQEHKNWQS